jgi:hypothetical protein
MREVILVIVARRQMRSDAARLLAAHDEQHLRVRLEADDAVDHLHARFLQTIGEAQIGLFVKARAQFDDDGDVLALPWLR